jgi:aminomethyltransferase
VLRDGERVGTVSSGNFSPTLEHGIALAFVNPEVEVGDTVSVDMRGSEAAATVAALPFVAKKS